jgi:hypothetical protein
MMAGRYATTPTPSWPSCCIWSAWTAGPTTAPATSTRRRPCQPAHRRTRRTTGAHRRLRPAHRRRQLGPGRGQAGLRHPRRVPEPAGGPPRLHPPPRRLGRTRGKRRHHHFGRTTEQPLRGRARRPVPRLRHRPRAGQSHAASGDGHQPVLAGCLVHQRPRQPRPPRPRPNMTSPPDTPIRPRHGPVGRERSTLADTPAHHCAGSHAPTIQQPPRRAS